MKFFVLFILTVGCLEQVTAQKKVNEYAIKAGLSYNSMNFKAGYPSTSTSNSFKPGWYAGAALNIPLSQTFALEPQYLYSMMKGEDKTRQEDYTLHYLSLPVYLHITLTDRLSLLGGPEFGLLIRAQQRSQGTVSNITHDTEERSISAVGGFAFRITESLYADARYVHGFNHIGLGQRSAVREFKWRRLEIGLSLRFHRAGSAL